VTNRFYLKRGDDVQEVFTWELFQKKFFQPDFGGAVLRDQRNVVLSAIDLTGFSFFAGPRHYSPIVSTLRASPRPGWSLSWSADYDPARHRVVNSMFQTSIRIRKYFASAGSDQVHPDPIISPSANQFRTTVGYGETNKKGWNVAFTSVYNVRQAQLQYGVAQAAYNTDCCGFAVQIRRSSFGAVNRNDYLGSFTIANFGSVGTLKKQERLF